jgi:hypothetical protein
MFGNRTISRRYCCLVLLPDKKEVREAVMDTLNEEQKSFPLDILVQTGNRRVSLDFMTPKERAFLDGTSSESTRQPFRCWSNHLKASACMAGTNWWPPE